ncbi:hypothetical protein G6O67_006550 [Ophiocordyceps sinensis]|uniref:Uncharacterized protein n=1 Tax=Ophiocordyceps sinensis TaxID=72228 RepID=A0A8H4PME2_9HYPO|nr:hypothetical protein G6O67_006550 [Ophiocordyceps sinensis]
MMLVSVLGTVLAASAASAAVVPVGAIPCNQGKSSGVVSQPPSPVAVEKLQNTEPVKLPGAQPVSSSQRPQCSKKPDTAPAAVPQNSPEKLGPVANGGGGGEQNGPPSYEPKGASTPPDGPPGPPSAVMPPCTKCATQPSVKDAAVPQSPPTYDPRAASPGPAGQPSAVTPPCAKCDAKVNDIGPEKPCSHKYPTNRPEAGPEAGPGPSGEREPSPRVDNKAPEQPTKKDSPPGNNGPALEEKSTPSVDNRAPERPTKNDSPSGNKGPAPAPGPPGQVGSPAAKPTCLKKIAGSAPKPTPATPAPVKPAGVPGQIGSPSKKPCLTRMPQPPQQQPPQKKPNVDDVTPATFDVNSVGKNGTPKEPDVLTASKPKGPRIGVVDNKPTDGPAPPSPPGPPQNTGGSNVPASPGQGPVPAPPGPSTPSGGKQTNLGTESSDKPGPVDVTPHVQYSSSVGALGCMINITRVAYWPGSPGCNDICMKLTSEKTGRSLHLLRVDTSGGATRDISYDAWNDLTGMTAGGKEPMTWEWADMSACSDLLRGGKMPIAYPSGVGWASGCLAKADQEGSSPNWLSQNYALFEYADMQCKGGTGAACTFDKVTQQTDCKNDGSTAKLPEIKDIQIGELPNRPWRKD